MEPSWLGAVATAQQDPGDPEMKILREKATGDDAKYTVHVVHGQELVYRVGAQRNLQLIIPRGHGLRQLLMQELHSLLYAAHLGVRKTLAALKQRVFWPGINRDVQKFICSCDVCAHTKDVNARA